MFIHNFLWLLLCVGAVFSSDCPSTKTITTDLQRNISSSQANTTGLSRKDVLAKTLLFLKSKNDLDFSSISMLMDEETCMDGMICKDIIRFLFSKENDIPFTIFPTYKGIKHLNITNFLDKSFGTNGITTDHKISLVIVNSPFETQILQDIFWFIGDTSIRNNFWLFLDTINKTNDISTKVIAAGNEKIEFSSRFFVLAGNSDIAMLSEIYKKCPSIPAIVSPVATLEGHKNDMDAVDIIWNRRQDLTGCPLRVAYINDPPFVYEKVNKVNQNVNSDCLQRSGKIICGSYIQFFKLMLDVLNFMIEWVNVKDNKYGSGRSWY